MAMSFATMQSLINAEPDANGKIRILVDYLRDNTLDGALAIVNAIPAADQIDSETIWSDEGVLKVSSTA